MLTVTLSRPTPLIVTRCSPLHPTYHVMVCACTKNAAIKTKQVSVTVVEIRMLPACVHSPRYLLSDTSQRSERKRTIWKCIKEVNGV